MSGPAYCLDSDVIIWHLRKGERQRAVEAHLEKLAAMGSVACSALTVAEVEQGVRKGEEGRTRDFLRALRPIPSTKALPSARASWCVACALGASRSGWQTRSSRPPASCMG